jgi:hypothetical protein
MDRQKGKFDPLISQPVFCFRENLLLPPMIAVSDSRKSNKQIHKLDSP